VLSKKKKKKKNPANDHLFIYRFRFHHKFRYRHRRTTGIDSVNSSIREANNSDVAFIKTTNTNGNLGNNSSGGGGNGCASFSSVSII
jgi:hypothetical protein